MPEGGRLDLQFSLAGREQGACLPDPPPLQWEFPLWQNTWLGVATDRTPVSSGPTGVSSLGHCGVHFRLTGVWFPQDLLGFQPCKICGVQFTLTGVWSPQDLLGFLLWDIVGFSSGWQPGFLRTCWGFSFGILWGSFQADGSLVSSGPIETSALGHCGVQLRLTWVWSAQDTLGFQFWDIVGFSSGWQERGLLRTHWGFSLGRCRAQFRLMESDLRTHWGFGFGTLWGSVQADRSLVPQDPLGFWLWDIVGFSSGWQEPGFLRTCWGFSFGILWGSFQAEGSLVFSGIAGRWCPWRKRWVKLGRRFLCVAVAECVCLQRTQDCQGLMWKVVFSQFLWYRMVSSVVLRCVVSLVRLIEGTVLFLQ